MINLHLEPDCRTAQQQRVRKQQIQIAIHAAKIASKAGRVKLDFTLISLNFSLFCQCDQSPVASETQFMKN
jgi:hypothetical protein